jgi:hypothetical protein
MCVQGLLKLFPYPTCFSYAGIQGLLNHPLLTLQGWPVENTITTPISYMLQVLPIKVTPYFKRMETIQNKIILTKE